MANRLHDLIREIRHVGIDFDEKRELLTLTASDPRDTRFTARELSDGTLRFLALAVLELDPGGRGLIGFEEPENGIHPRRIPAIMRLLKDIAFDPAFPAGPDNPLQQVIVNTHSPGVVGEVADDDLLYADSRDRTGPDGQRQAGVVFEFPAGTWREQWWLQSGGPGTPPLISPGDIRAYLSPVRDEPDLDPAVPVNGSNLPTRLPARPRIADRPDYRVARSNGDLYSGVGADG